MAKSNFQKLHEAELKLELFEKFAKELSNVQNISQIRRLKHNYLSSAAKQKGILNQSLKCIRHKYPPSAEQD